MAHIVLFLLQRHQRHSTMHDVYETTQTRANLIRNAGYNLVEIWSCEWNKPRKQNHSIQICINSLQLISQLEARDAFFGGRTNAVKLYYKTEEGEMVHPMDFTSLYPYVNKNSVYPVDLPVIILEPGHSDLS